MFRSQKTLTYWIAAAALLAAPSWQLGASPIGAGGQAGMTAVAPALLDGMAWRNIGPDRGGRSLSATGVVGRPNEGYFGEVGGGL